MLKLRFDQTIEVPRDRTCAGIFDNQTCDCLCYFFFEQRLNPAATKSLYKLLRPSGFDSKVIVFSFFGLSFFGINLG